MKDDLYTYLDQVFDWDPISHRACFPEAPRLWITAAESVGNRPGKPDAGSRLFRKEPYGGLDHLMEDCFTGRLFLDGHCR